MVFVCLDTETTGLEKENHCIWQISGIIKSDKGEESFNFKMKPYSDEPMSTGAFIKTGITQEELDSYPDQKLAFKQFTSLMYKHITKEDGTREKAYLIGYNVQFDTGFIEEWFKFNDKPYMFRSLFWFPYIDVMQLASFYLVGKRPYMTNFKLATVYESLMGHSFENQHSADADSLATWELFSYLADRLISTFTKPEIPVRKIAGDNT